jgi:nucleoside-diphosphate-sugar epimerase
MAKIFLTNATGYIGSAIAKLAREKGYEVTAQARSDESEARLQEHKVKAHRGDLRQPETFTNVLKEYDVVIHTGADYTGDFAGTDQKATRAILDTLKGTNKQFIYTSGVWVLGNTGDQPATEETPTAPFAGLEWRAELERQVLEANKNGVKAVVVRPGLVYGRGGGLIAGQFQQAKKHGEVKIVGEGKNRFSLVHIDDTATLYVAAVEKKAENVVLHGTSGKTATQREVAELVAKVAGVPGKVRALPIADALKEIGFFAAGLQLDQNIQSPNAKKVVGWEPKGPELAQEIEQFAKQPATVG